MTPDQIRIIKQVNKTKADVARFEQHLLKLLAHPDATPEQIEQVRTAYMDIKDRLQDVGQKVWTATHGRVSLC